MKTIFNRSECRMESAKLEQCPRCRGFGRNFGDTGDCGVCRGHGRAWIAASGWTLAKFAKVERDERLF